MSQNDFDFSALSQPVSRDDIAKYAPNEMNWVTPGTLMVARLVLGAFFVLPAIIGAIVEGRLLTGGSLLQIAICTLIVLGVVKAAAYGARLGAEEMVRLTKFAQRNGATVISNSTQSMPGMIFDNGHSRRVERAIVFNDGVEIGNYEYVTGSGKNSTVHTYAYARVALNRNLPHMVLDSRNNNFIGTNLPDSFDTSQKLTLEGNFSDYFDLYAPGGYQRDALYVFTPDVMQALVKHGRNRDMEIIGNELYIYFQGRMKLSDETELRQWLEIIDAIGGELKDQTRRYTDERSQITDVVGSTASMPLVAPQGQRLKTRTNIAVIVFFFVLIFLIVAPSMLPERLADYVVLVGWPIFLLWLAVVIIGKVVVGLRRS